MVDTFIERLRTRIKNELETISDGVLMHFDAHLLDSLLFDTFINEKKNIKIKVPVWSGDFLKKIDLSKVSFEDVSWSLYMADCIGEDQILAFKRYYSRILNKEQVSKLLKCVNTSKVKSEKYKQFYCVNYAHTNAHINLKKSYEAKKYGKIITRYCDFSGLDFSKINLSDFSRIYYCNFSDTNLKIPRFIADSNIILKNCDFTNLDFSNVTVLKRDIKLLSSCNMSQTGLRVDFDLIDNCIDDSEDPYNDERLKHLNDKIAYRKQISTMARENRLHGCYINNCLLCTRNDNKDIMNSCNCYSDYDLLKNKLL